MIRLVEFGNICCDDGSWLFILLLPPSLYPTVSLCLSLFLSVFPPFLAVHNLRKLFFFVIVSFVLFFCCCPSQDPSVVGAYCSLGHSLPCPDPFFDIVPICSHIMTHGICVSVCVCRHFASCRLRNFQHCNCLSLFINDNGQSAPANCGTMRGEPYNRVACELVMSLAECLLPHNQFDL